jgi:type I restriction enzyme S subunit
MSLPRYPEYKDSGLAWLGDVPAHWNIQRIKDTTYLKGRVGWKGLTSDEYLEEGYAYLVTGTDFSNRFISWSECHCVERDRYEDDPFIQLRNGDLLITKDGTIGKLALVKDLDRPACLNSGIFLVRPERSYITEYMYWVLSSSAFSVFCDLSSFGSTIQHLYQNVFERFYFPIPLREEQSAIASFLDRETAKIDALVAEQEKLIALLKEKRQAVISHAVTKGLDPNVPMKDSGIEWLGEVPTHWEICHLKRMISLITDGAHVSPETDGGVYDFVSTKDVLDEAIDFEGALKTSPSSYEYLVRTGCRPFRGDLLFSKDGTIGRTVVVRDDHEFVVASSLIIIRPTQGVLASQFLNYLCQADFVQQQVDRFVKGAGLPRLSIQNLLKVVGVFPPKSEQNEIALYLDEKTASYRALIKEAQSAVSLLQERRRALISAAVTGKIDVRGLAQMH